MTRRKIENLDYLALVSVRDDLDALVNQEDAGGVYEASDLRLFRRMLSDINTVLAKTEPADAYA